MKLALFFSMLHTQLDFPIKKENSYFGHVVIYINFDNIINYIFSETEKSSVLRHIPL